MKVTGTYDARIDSPPLETLAPSLTHTTDPTANSVTDHNATQQTGGHAPTEGGRETTTDSNVPGYAEIEELVKERLANDPDYQALSAKLEKWKDIENDFALVDANTGLFPDGTVTLDNLRALAGDPLARTDAREAAKRLLSEMSIWNEIAKGDNIAGTHDVMAFVAGMKDGLKAMKDAARADIRAEVGAATPAANAATAAGPGGAAASAAEGTEPLFKAPVPSTKPGMEGAVENINNAVTSIGDSMKEISAKIIDPKTPPEERNKLQAKYNELQQLQAMMMAMYKQMQEAIANIMKMYSDVAQNSIRNMR